MTTSEKRLQRLLSVPVDMTWDEMVAFLADVGFVEVSTKGGSYRTFVSAVGRKIYLHRPHPRNVVKRYAIRDVIAKLKEFGMFQRGWDE